MSGKTSVPIYKIHPFLGIARLGNSLGEFCISPETPAALPIACDQRGNPMVSVDGAEPVAVRIFKDEEGRIKRQAARFQVYVYDDTTPEGRPLHLGDEVYGGGNHGKLVDIQWRVYLANKKSCWYQFKQLEGEHGYAADHPLRNPDITDSDARQFLIIDPGPQVINATSKETVHCDRKGNGLYAPTFPPENLHPARIDTLGNLLTDDAGRLLVLGGHGNSGSMLKGFGQPRIDTYANNDGWFDDTSDGPVSARLIMYSSEVTATRYIDVEYPAWVVCGYPAYVPEILDMVTLDDVVQNTALTQFAYRTDIYGQSGTFTEPQKVDPSDVDALDHWKASNLAWNTTYKPWFYRDIWPILFRADEYTYLTNVLQNSNYPHNQTRRGNFDPTKLSIPPALNVAAFERSQAHAITANQDGDLFLDALEPIFQQLDHQTLNTPRSVRKPMLSAKFQQRADVREELRAALKHFAAATTGSQPLDDAEDYILHWQRAFANAQDPANEGTAQYQKASDALHDVIRHVLEELEAVSDPPMLLARRDDENPVPFATPGPDEPVESALERLYTAFRSGKLLTGKLDQLRNENTWDPFFVYRNYLHDLLRKEGEEDTFRLDGRPTSRTHHLPLMPLLAGDNPISNTFASKFLRLTDYQLFLLRQWARGEFFNEKIERWIPEDSVDPWLPYATIKNHSGRDLDQNVLSNLGGGAFCPGAEVGWIIRNPAIYFSPYRIKADPAFSSFRQTAANENQNSVPEANYVSATQNALSLGSDYRSGLQPGDLTKTMALPWQADFNECSSQMIDVTYEMWNVIDPQSEHDEWMKREQKLWETLWWPAHRPMQVWEKVGGTDANPQYLYLSWARGIPQTNAGDLKMVTEWSRLGIVIRNPYLPPEALDIPSPGEMGATPPQKYLSVERNQTA